MKNEFETQEKGPRISPELLKEIQLAVLTMPLEDHEFLVENQKFILRVCPSKNDQGGMNGQSGEYFARGDAWVIYVWDDLPEKIQRVIIFHEIVEVYFLVTYSEEQSVAHEAALPYEEDFKKGLLSADEERQIQELRTQF